ncbi:unnamed protein product [Ascophyllum nodosum]
MASLSAAIDSGLVDTGPTSESTADAAAAAATDAKATFNAARRRSSSSGRNNSTATMRLSISDIVNVHGKERHADEEQNKKEIFEKGRRERRASSLLQMGVASTAIREVATTILQNEVENTPEVAGGANPVQKLQELLTRAKEKGMSAERLFEYFAPNGETSVTPDMFEAGLRTLGRQTFDLDAVELDHLVSTLDSNGSGTIELDDFMTFCLSIPSLPWRAERARRLRNAESKEDLNVAARKVDRRRSSLRAIPIGTLLHQGSQFFWRSKESIDVAFHYNSDEGLITISTRCPSRGYNYPAIFVDASKIPVSKGDAVERADGNGKLENLKGRERQDMIEKAMAALRVEYLQHRLKVPDEVNKPTDENETAEVCQPGGPLGGINRTMVGFSGTTPRERAEDKARHRPFLVKLSTDKEDDILSRRNIVLQTPHRFSTPARPRSSMDDFRRTSLEFDQLAKETEKLSTMAERRTRNVEDSIDRISAATGGSSRAP